MCSSQFPNFFFFKTDYSAGGRFCGTRSKLFSWRHVIGQFARYFYNRSARLRRPTYCRSASLSLASTWVGRRRLVLSRYLLYIIVSAVIKSSWICGQSVTPCSWTSWCVCALWRRSQARVHNAWFLDPCLACCNIAIWWDEQWRGHRRGVDRRAYNE